jgi:hypothetical protein
LYNGTDAYDTPKMNVATAARYVAVVLLLSLMPTPRPGGALLDNVRRLHRATTLGRTDRCTASADTDVVSGLLRDAVRHTTRYIFTAAFAWLPVINTSSAVASTVER